MDPGEQALAKKIRLLDQLRDLYEWRSHFGVLAELQEELERSTPQPAADAAPEN
jgi:hypothetical protein